MADLNDRHASAQGMDALHGALTLVYERRISGVSRTSQARALGVIVDLGQPVDWHILDAIGLDKQEALDLLHGLAMTGVEELA